MSCYRPLTGYRIEGGGISIGYEPRGTVETLKVPCGRCIGCRLEYSLTWAIRCRHEASLWTHNAFVTLTYDDEHLPAFGSLQPKQLQLFLKRLRKAIPGAERAPDDRLPVRYFAAGEYGGQSERPHYHLLLFNVRLERGTQVGKDTWSCPDLEILWPFGANAVGDVTPKSAAYVSQYSLKKVKGRLAAKRFYERVDPQSGEVVDLVPEFVRMSRCPGLGYWWYERYSGDLDRGYCVVDGKKHRMPRYYMRRLEAAGGERAYDLEVAKEAYMLGMGPRSEEQLQAAESIELSKRGLLSRERGL